MAKKTYTVQDEEGATWVVFQGDPAYPLVTQLKHPTPVLPRAVIMSGSMEGVDYTKWGRMYANLAMWMSKNYLKVEPEDEAALVRLTSLSTCIDQLRILPEEAT